MIRVDIHDRVARIRLDRPERLNAISPQMLRDLTAVCGDIAGDASLRVVAIEGSGESFSAGADLPEFASELRTTPHETADIGRVATEALAALPQITVALIKGHCVGGGVVLAAACDLRICAGDTRFVIPELELGIPLAWGGMAHLIRLVGETVATDLVLSCRPFDADDALRVGFVSRVVTSGSLDTEASRLIETIAQRSHLTLLATKRQLRAIRRGTYDPADDASTLLECFNDPDAAGMRDASIDRLR